MPPAAAPTTATPAPATNRRRENGYESGRTPPLGTVARHFGDHRRYRRDPRATCVDERLNARDSHAFGPRKRSAPATLVHYGGQITGWSSPCTDSGRAAEGSAWRARGQHRRAGGRHDTPRTRTIRARPGFSVNGAANPGRRCSLAERRPLLPIGHPPGPGPLDRRPARPLQDHQICGDISHRVPLAWADMALASRSMTSNALPR
jgi:hypothetical protein